MKKNNNIFSIGYVEKNHETNAAKIKYILLHLMNATTELIISVVYSLIDWGSFIDKIFVKIKKSNDLRLDFSLK